MQYGYKQIWQIAYPILVGMIIQQLIGLTDTAFLGRVGKVELGASAIASVFYVMIFMLGYGFAVGAQILIAQNNGAKKYKRIGQIFYQSLFFLFVCAAFIIISLHLFAADCLRFLISSDEVYKAAMEYLIPRSYGFIFSFMIVMFRSYYIGITDTKVLSLNAFVMLIANVGLDYILIFGKFGCPVMGIRGAAIASVLAEASSAIFFIIYTLKKNNYKKFGLDIPYFRNLKILIQIMRLSVWCILQNVVSLSTWLFFMLAVEHLGENELAISNVLRSISALPFMVINALYGTANTIAGNLTGLNEQKQIFSSVRKIITLGYLCGFVVISLLVISPFYVMRIYTDDTMLIHMATNAYYASMTSYFTLVPGFILLGVISGMGKTQIAMALELLALGVYVIGVWFVVIFWQADIAICWLTEHPYNIVLTISTFFYLRKKIRFSHKGC